MHYANITPLRVTRGYPLRTTLHWWRISVSRRERRWLSSCWIPSSTASLTSTHQVITSSWHCILLFPCNCDVAATSILQLRRLAHLDIVLFFVLSVVMCRSLCALSVIIAPFVTAFLFAYNLFSSFISSSLLFSSQRWLSSCVLSFLLCWRTRMIPQ